MSKPSLPQGTRDFGAETVRKRNYILDTIRRVFELYGFQPLETPAMENIETLMGKYGEEGDKLIFRILNNGLDNPAKAEQARQGFEKILQGKNAKEITERALKYDLTIPFARYVAMNHGQLNYPFKRYQVQPVWRADRPQKGRYREFYQCDADVVGSDSLWNEVELIIIYASVFAELGIPAGIRINNRKLLSALAEQCGGIGKMTDIAVAIDKLEKTGAEKLKQELQEKGFTAEQIALIHQYLSLQGDNAAKLSGLKDFFRQNDTGKTGITEIASILSRLPSQYDEVMIDLSLARGLNYYTGIIFEVKVKDLSMGSIGGGGRYDDLTGLFGVKGIPGVGISFGVDRIYDVMEELNLFPEAVHTGTQVLFFNMGETESKAAFGVMQQLRGKHISCELYPEPAKFDKQFKYAEKKNIPYAVIMGTKEIEEKNCGLKDLRKGEQKTITVEQLINYTF